MSVKALMGTVLFMCVPILSATQEEESILAPDILFCIGTPDAYCKEFALAGSGIEAYREKFPAGVEYIVGKSKPETDWPFVHPGSADQFWAWGGLVHPFTIKFDAKPNSEPLAFVIGYMATSNSTPRVEVTVNGKALPTQVPRGLANLDNLYNPTARGRIGSMLFPIPAGSLKDGVNEITIRLLNNRWIMYDYIALREENKPLLTAQVRPEVDLLAPFRAGPMKDVRKIVFAVRPFGIDGHWYASFGYYSDDENRVPYPHLGGKLCILDLDTQEVQTLLDAPEGVIRDPIVHYDAEKILFSYRPAGSEFFHLYEINIDGSGLRQITSGEFDDMEPTYLPSGDIMFVSSRANRWVNCWMTPTAVLYRCDANGGNIQEISSNIEHDNTPWMLPNGQVMYTRWEYIDRSQEDFHHLWVMNPDGIRQAILYGNLHPGIVMLDAKPIPGSEKIVASFSPGHGLTEHAGVITVVDPRNGPDDLAAATPISHHVRHRDPWAFSETAFLAADEDKMVLVDENGNEQAIYTLPEEQRRLGMKLHEPRPLVKREREQIIPELADWQKTTGELAVMNVYEGRNMEGIPPGSIKNLLVLETLPKPINYSGSMEPMTYGGTYTLVRIIGSVPVEEDGSAFMELPALRSFFFVALDENDLSVKRMQSFLTVIPGESTSCVGCHEHRTASMTLPSPNLLATRRPPSKPIPYTGIPDVLDYPRDIQPIWDRHCVECHNAQERNGNISLIGDRTPIYTVSFIEITMKSLVADGRNVVGGNFPPYALGTSTSQLMKYCDESHYGVNLSERELQTVKLWVETGAAYPGTYAALGTGMVGGYLAGTVERPDLNWPEMKASIEVLQQSCTSCHTLENAMPIALSPTHDIINRPNKQMAPHDARRKFSRDMLYNLTNPKDSLVLLAPLAKSAGGYESCGKAVFESTGDPCYQTVLAAIERTKQHLDEIKRFDMPGFIPRAAYIREMKKYHIIPQDANPNQVFDTYQLDRDFWQSHWYRP